MSLKLHTMLAVYDNYVDDLHVVFNAKKSKCRAQVWPRQSHGLPELHIGGTAMEFVENGHSWVILSLSQVTTKLTS